MTHGPEHHIEHAEHAAHAVHDEFNKRVTMSIAIVAAVLACVTMLGHRSHNEVLRLQGEALQKQTLAGIQSTKSANHWQYYQTKNLFHLESKIAVDMLQALPTNAAAEKIGSGYQKTVDKYSPELPKLVEKGKEMDKKTDEYIHESEEEMKKSHAEHEKAALLDYGELGLQFGVVLCSLAILTKSRGFWFGGLLSSLVGLVVAMIGQFGIFVGSHH